VRLPVIASLFFQSSITRCKAKERPMAFSPLQVTDFFRDMTILHHGLSFPSVVTLRTFRPESPVLGFVTCVLPSGMIFDFGDV
jgi:hypothetical protein